MKRKNHKADFTEGCAWLTVLIAELLYIYFMPRAMIYSDNDILETVSIILTLGLIFGLIPYTVYRTAKSFGANNNFIAGLPFLAILITGPTFGLYHDYTARTELRKTGVWTKCVVIDDNWRRGTHDIKCTFTNGVHLYNTPYLSDINNNYNIGDTLDIIYSKDYPKMNILECDWTENDDE